MQKQANNHVEQLLTNVSFRSALIVLLARQDIHTGTLSKIEDILVKDRAQRETVRMSQSSLCKMQTLD